MKKLKKLTCPYEQLTQNYEQLPTVKQSNYTLPETKTNNICFILLITLLFLFLGYLGYLGITYYNLAHPTDAFCKTNYESRIDIKEARGCEDYYLSRGY